MSHYYFLSVYLLNCTLLNLSFAKSFQFSYHLLNWMISWTTVFLLAQYDFSIVLWIWGDLSKGARIHCDYSIKGNFWSGQCILSTSRFKLFSDGSNQNSVTLRSGCIYLQRLFLCHTFFFFPWALSCQWIFDVRGRCYIFHRITFIRKWW